MQAEANAQAGPEFIFNVRHNRNRLTMRPASLKQRIDAMIPGSWKSVLLSLCVFAAWISAPGPTLFAQTGNVVISTNTTYATGTYSLTSLTVENGATLTVGGGSTLTVSGAVLVTANSSIVLQGANTSAQVNGAWAGVGSTINAATVEVDTGSSINADAQGYTANSGPGAATSGTNGGSYGGAGGGQASTTRYGSDTAPVDLGSGGGTYESIGGTGGGALRLIVSGTLTNNGIISADGGTYIVCTGSGACGAGFGGGGAGGSVYVTAGTLTGSGTFNADGGPNATGNGGGGGGGRVAVYYASATNFSGMATSTASGGAVGAGGSPGSAGTVAFFSGAGSGNNGALIVDQPFTIPAGTTATYAAITVQNGATLTVGGGSTLTVNGAVLVTANSNIVLQGANTSAQVNGAWAGVGSTINASSLEVDSGSSINADAQGYTASNGPGAAANGTTSGGSYGGAGGGQASTTTYGSDTAPIDLGSGGGSYESIGGTGGGAIKLVVSGTLTNNGLISANGGTYIVCTGSGACGGGFAGGGGGGSIDVSAGSLAGSGTFNADGGPNATSYGSGGGGGRVAVYYNASQSTFNGFTGSTASGGVAPTGNGAVSGTVGTIAFFDTSATNDDVTVYQNFIVPAGSTVQYASLTVTNGATLTIGGGSTVKVAGAVVVTGNSTVVVQGANTTAQVNGAWAGVGSTISAATLEVDAGSSINADGQGYSPFDGPGSSVCCTVNGGSYGGAGGGQALSTTYGSETAPVDLGSGGGQYQGTSLPGGGAVHLIVSGTLTNNGIVSANAPAVYGFVGGSAGGSVYVTTGALAGSGTFNANGGSNSSSYGSGGGGGRVAVYYNAQQSSFTGFTGSTASGGVAPPGNGGVNGSVGTIAFFDTSATNENVTVYQNYVIPAATSVQFNSLTVTNGALVTVGGGSTISVAGSMLVTGNSNIIVQSANTAAQVNGVWAGTGGTIQAGSLEVDAGSAISADGQGYNAVEGPGAGALGSTNGGSYGGAGGGQAVGTTYGSATAPMDLGSGGGVYQGTGTSGGGAIRIIVAGTFTNNGIVSANAPAVYGFVGGSAGGSVYVTSGTLTGSGTFNADGGGNASTYGSGGGGGRVAVYYNNAASFTGFTGSTATGPAVVPGNGGSSGANGTVGFFDASVPNYNLATYQNFTIPGGTSATYNAVAVSAGALLTIGGGAALTLNNSLTVNGTVVAQSQNNTAQINGVWVGSGAAITAGSITVNAGGSLNADALGYVPNEGPGGATTRSGTGGSYGGLGGYGGNAPGPTYGSEMLPVDLGSGGDSTSGGGELLLTVSGTLTDNGIISANGANGNGGGAGGSVQIHTATLAGSGSIAANGGSGDTAGGGGGRVALYFNTNTFNVAQATASGGTSGNGNAGAVGTVYIPGPVMSTTALSASPAQLSVGQTATFQALVTATPPGPTSPGPTPTGLVTFLDGATLIGTQTLTASQPSGTATAQFQTMTLAVGTHNITASYAGSGIVLASTSGAQTVSVTQATPTTSLRVSAANSTAAQSETLTATVTGLPSPAITGNVTFFDGTTSLGNGTLAVTGGTGTASLIVPSLSVGQHSITVRYNGDTNYIASSSATQTVTVSQIASATRLAVSAATIDAGQPETLTATIAGAASPTLSGVVTFFDGTTSIGTSNVTATATGGTAALALTTLATGARSLTARYGGDTNYTASVSGAQTVTVTATPQTITFPAIPNHVYGDPPFALTATASSGLAVSYNVVGGPATVSGSTVTLTGAGTVTVQATQPGNTVFAAATPVSQSFIVTAPALTLASITPTIGIVGSGATTVTLTGTNFATTDTVQLNGTPIPSTLMSATSLMATLPASFFAAAGTGLITVADAASGTVTSAATFTVAAAPQFVLSGPSTATSDAQPALTFTLSNPYPFPLAGALSLAFAPVASAGVTDDQTVQFATGGRTIDFSIPANSTATPAVQLQTGTIAGTATVTLAVTSAGVSVTPANLAPVVITIPAAVPTLMSAKTTQSGQTLTVAVVGFSNTREVTKAVFHFTSAAGSSIKDPDVTVDVTTVFAGWYGSTASDGYGSAFTYTQPFMLDSDVSVIAGVTVTLTNSVGVSVVLEAQ
jgi:hypothetical protein